MIKCITKKSIGIVSAIVIAVLLFSNLKVYAKSGDWGLGFPKPGETPIGNESVEYLKQFDSYFIGNTKEKEIFLTFDAGYENGYTSDILDVLKKEKVPATFFLVGHYIKQNTDLVKRMINEGHFVGNHTLQHPDMTKLTDKESFNKQIVQLEDLYRTVTGQEISKFYRPPFGRYSEQNLQMAKDLGYKTILWSSAYKDYENDNQPTREEAFDKLMPRIHAGSVLLLHNTSKTNSLILEELIQRCRQNGYVFKSLDCLGN